MLRPLRHPTKPHGGEIFGSGVEVTAESVDTGTWSADASAGIAAKLTRSRTRYRDRRQCSAVHGGGEGDGMRQVPVSEAIDGSSCTGSTD